MRVGLWVSIVLYFSIKTRLNIKKTLSNHLQVGTSLRNLIEVRREWKRVLLMLLLAILVLDILIYFYLIDLYSNVFFTLIVAILLSFRVVIVNNTFYESRKSDLFTLDKKARFLRGYEFLLWLEVLFYPYLIFTFINLLLG